MSNELELVSQPLPERRGNAGDRLGVERRQFADAHDDLSPEARDLAIAVDNYKRAHRRRFITHEEMITVIKSLGYSK